MNNKIKLLIFAFLTAAALPVFSKQLPQNEWSAVKAPLGSTAQAIGFYSNGCQTGAEILPESGRGFYSIRRFRNRFYSQPITLQLVYHIGKYIDSRHNSRILVGDLSLPIGGKMPYGHSSHQSGLDVDFWFYETKTPPATNLEPPTMVDKGAGKMIIKNWRQSYRDALYAAATFEQTARIFVNPVIKQYLCQTESDRQWLRKLRAWWGHDAHFHVRLHCPQSSPDCKEQQPIAKGDGCDGDLANWIRDQSEAILNPKPQAPRAPKLPKPKPEACKQLLNQALKGQK